MYGIRLAVLAVLGCALLACGATRTESISMPDESYAAASPPARPPGQSVEAKLVRFPGREVDYVANADRETFHFRRIYYTYYNHSWFYAESMRGPWRFVEMKYAPAELFAVRGTTPPRVVRAGGAETSGAVVQR